MKKLIVSCALMVITLVSYAQTYKCILREITITNSV